MSRPEGCFRVDVDSSNLVKIELEKCMCPVISSGLSSRANSKSELRQRILPCYGPLAPYLCSELGTLSGIGAGGHSISLSTSGTPGGGGVIKGPGY